MPTKRSRPAAYTLVELVISSAIATILVGGMTSSIYLASQALDVTEDTTTNHSRTTRALDQLVRDLRHAREFTERTSTAMTFTVPDRDGDGHRETLRYAWSGTSGDPITFAMNDEAGVDLVEDVTAVNFDYLERTLEAREVDLDTTPLVMYEGYADARLTYNNTALSVALPADTAEGDLLVACLVTDGNTTAAMDIPAGGWTSLGTTCESDAVTLGVWWKIAGASEANPVAFTWTGSEQAYGWIVRITGHDPITPIHASSIAQGQVDDPATPSIATSVGDCLILRVGAFDDNDIDVPGDVGMTDHTTIVMRSSNSGTGTCSGGAAYTNKGPSGVTGEAHFNAGGYEQYVTATIAIAPPPEED